MYNYQLCSRNKNKGCEQLKSMWKHNPECIIKLHQHYGAAFFFCQKKKFLKGTPQDIYFLVISGLKQLICASHIL